MARFTCDGWRRHRREPAGSAQQQKPNILFIMGDDIGCMQPSIYHRGLMVGETPNIDRIGNEGAIFMDYVAMQKLHLRAQRLLHRHVSGAHRAWFRRSFRAARPTCNRAPRRLQYSCATSATRPASSARTTWATTPRPCRRRTASRSIGATSTTLMPCNRSSFPDINKTPTVALPRRAAVQEHTDFPVFPRCRVPSTPKTTTCLTTPRPSALVQVLEGRRRNQDLPRRGPAHPGAFEDRRRGNLRQSGRLPRPQRPEKTGKPFFVSGTTRPACTSPRCCQ